MGLFVLEGVDWRARRSLVPVHDVPWYLCIWCTGTCARRAWVPRNEVPGTSERGSWVSEVPGHGLGCGLPGVHSTGRFGREVSQSEMARHCKRGLQSGSDFGKLERHDPADFGKLVRPITTLLTDPERF